MSVAVFKGVNSGMGILSCWELKSKGGEPGEKAIQVCVLVSPKIVSGYQENHDDISGLQDV